MAESLTQEQAIQTFDYDHETGELIWKRRHGIKTPIGKVAGSRHRSGYTTVKVNQEQYLAHRIVWLMFYGEYPELDIDHINRSKRDNRLGNLRLATRSENCLNVGLSSANKSGHKGVFWHSQSRKWEASIRVSGSIKTIGRFASLGDAVAARATKAEELYGHLIGVQ